VCSRVLKNLMQLVYMSVTTGRRPTTYNPGMCRDLSHCGVGGGNGALPRCLGASANGVTSDPTSCGSPSGRCGFPHLPSGKTRDGSSRSSARPNRFGQSRFIVTSRFRHHRHHFIFTGGCSGPFFDPFLCQRAFFSAPPFWSSPLFWPDVPQTYPAVQQTEAVQYQPDTELRAEISRLAEEVEMLREQQARNAPQPAPSQAPQRPASTVLVFRDGHRTEVQNYGIVGQTLWIFTEQRARKIPLSDLDMDATQEANAERGVEFLAPRTP
jgi:hypothetical protein